MGNNVQSALMTNTFVFTFLILMYSAYTILLPGLYYDFLTNFPEPASLLQIYMFPIFDLILYSILLYGNSKIDEKAKLFTSVFHFLQLGYLVGTCLLVGIAEVEFYYLLSYIGLRNLFTNRLMESWKSCVNNPICLSGWILFYLLSYVFNTVPIIGLGRIVISKSFFSQILSLTKPILHYYEPTQNLYHKTPI